MSCVQKPYRTFKRDFVDVLDTAPAAPAARVAPAPVKAAPAVKAAPVKPAEQVKAVDIPDDVIAIKAYILWEQGGRQDGADFSDKARKDIAAELSRGVTMEVCNN